MHPWIGLHPDLTSYPMPVSSPQPIPGRNSPYSPMPEPFPSSPHTTTPMKKISPSEVSRPRSGTFSGNSPSGQVLIYKLCCDSVSKNQFSQLIKHRVLLSHLCLLEPQEVEDKEHLRKLEFPRY